MTNHVAVTVESWQQVTREAMQRKQENAQLREALDLLRPAHRIPYVDEDHQGGNCADVVLAQVTRAMRAELAVAAIREWCDKTAAAASGDQSEPVWQARMELVDEIRALLPEVTS